MVIAERAKKSKVAVDQQDSSSDDHIDAHLVLSIEKLQDLQDQLEKVNEEASDKVLEVEQKYNEIRRPVYVRRSEIIKSIPDFWLTAFLSHPALGDIVNEEDKKIFKYLDSLDVEDFKDVKSGYSITFNFKPNPYFEDTKLTKTFTFCDDETKITGTSIKWKEGMGSVNGVNHKKKGNKRPPSEESFFIWFNETKPKNILQGLPDQVAEIIKEDLWSNPLKYFNTEEDEEDSDADEDDYEDNTDDEDDEEEDDL
ncbi:hypothetical protein LguiA_017194 [Lonicera macranthoides]